MNPTHPTSDKFRQFGRTLLAYRWLWVLPTLLLPVAALGYARLRPVVWEASQGLLLRDDALTNQSRQGRFDGTESRKAAQETILEMLRNRQVVAAALVAIGPPIGYAQPRLWPQDADTAQARDDVTIRAPKGGEFGRSEVMYLSVKRPTRAGAIALTTALCDQLDVRMQMLRKSKAEGLIGELQKNLETARTERDAVARCLQTLETEVGSDLGELRTLTEPGAGESNLRMGSNKIKEELRQAQAKHSANQQLQAMLAAALKNPNEVLAMPNQLLESQPALRRLKEGLIDAQLRTSQILGRTSAEHPAAQAAATAEDKIRQNMQAELATALRGVTADEKLSASAVASLEGQLADVQGRLDRLARLRVTYSNLVAETRQRNQRVEETEKALTEARVSQGPMQSSSLITRLDSPQTGDSPLGPGTLALVASGLGGGLVLGIGLVLLVAPSASGRGRRWSDYLPLAGRRKTDAVGQQQPAAPARRAEDRSFGRRAEDVPLPPVARPQAGDRRQGGDRRAGGPGIVLLPGPAPDAPNPTSTPT
jgi:uncharacterized protein involved in exopolysaccharide biosynthesis